MADPIPLHEREATATDVVPRQIPLTQPARFQFDTEQIAALRRTVAKDCSDAEFVVFLELSGRYGLDPFAKHIYAAKMPGKDGAAPAVTMIVSRDGLLSIANRHADFRGMTGDVVRKGDRLVRNGDEFTHSYDSLAEERDELPIVGAWAKVRRGDRDATFFYAPFKSYKTGNKTWSKYPDAMILKVAESMALRKAYSISGVVGEDEIAGIADPLEPVDQEPDYGPEPLASRLRALFAAANELRPGAFRDQKVRVTLAGADDAKRLRVAGEVEAFILRHGGELPEEEVADAEIVDEDEAHARADAEIAEEEA